MSINYRLADSGSTFKLALRKCYAQRWNFSAEFRGRAWR